MPIQIIPAPNVPDSMQQMGQMYEMMTMMQQAPLKKQLLEAQILGQQQDSARADRQMSIAEQDAANRQKVAGRAEVDAQREDAKRVAMGNIFQKATAEAAAAGEITPEVAQSQQPLMGLGAPEVLDPAVQARLFAYRLAADPDLSVKWDTHNTERSIAEQTLIKTQLEIQKLRLGGDTSKELFAAVNALDDNLARDDADISKNQAEIADLPRQAVKEWATIQNKDGGFSFDEETAKKAWVTDEKGNPKLDANGNMIPTPEFQPVWMNYEPKVAASKAAIEWARERRKQKLEAAQKFHSELADVVSSRFDVPQLGPRPKGAPPPEYSRTPGGDAATDDFANLVSGLAKAQSAGGDTLKSRIKSLRDEYNLPPDPSKVDAWVDIIFPPSSSATDPSREALKMKFKSMILSTIPPPGPPGAGAGAVGR